MLHARHKGILHPHDHISLVSFDNVGNIIFWRVAPEPDDTLVADLDSLLHEIRPDLRSAARVGTAIPVYLALIWVGSAASRVKDPKRLEALRDGLGYTLPAPDEVAPAVDTMVDAFIGVLPETKFGQVAFAAGPTRDREVISDPAEAVLPSQMIQGSREGRCRVVLWMHNSLGTLTVTTNHTTTPTVITTVVGRLNDEQPHQRRQPK